MSKFRKKPVVIEAVQYDGHNGEIIRNWARPSIKGLFAGDRANELVIETREGMMRASVGDWVIRGVAGEFYPCKPDIFEATYESADPDPQAGGEGRAE